MRLLLVIVALSASAYGQGQQQLIIGTAISTAAAIAWGNSAQTTTNGTTTCTVTTLTVAGSNTAMVGMIAMSNGSGISADTAVWDVVGANQSLTAITGAGGTSSSTSRVKIYGLVAPTAGNKTLTFSWTGTSDVTCWAAYLTGVNQTGGATTFAQGKVANADSTNASTTVTSTTSDIVICVYAADGGGTAGSPSLTTMGTAAQNNGQAAAQRGTGATTTTCSWTNTFDHWVIAGASIVHN